MRKLFLNIALTLAFLFSYTQTYNPAFATVTTATNLITYTGDNATTPFSFPYLFYDEDHLVVTLAGVTQTITTNYTVTGEGVAAGGTVTFVSAPGTDVAIIIQRIVPYVQNTDFTNFDGNPADVTERQFDLNTMMASQVGESSDRNITVPVGTTLTSNDISGTIDTTSRLLTITTSGPATALVGDLDDNLNVILTSQTAGDLLIATDGTTWGNVTQVSLGLLTDVVSDTTPQLGGFLDPNSQYIGWDKGGDIASASPLVIDTDGNMFDVTGTTGFSTMTVAADRKFTLQFDGALTITDGAPITLTGNANHTTAAGDVLHCQSTAANVVLCDIVKTDGTAVTQGSGAWTKLATATASNSATIDFTSSIDSAYDEYKLHIINAVPATDSVLLYLRTSTDGGSTFDNGAGEYRWTRTDMHSNTSTVGGSNSNSDTEIEIIKALGSAAGEGFNAIITLFKPSGTRFTQFGFSSYGIDASGRPSFSVGVGARQSAADVDAVRFFMSSGNITSGEFKLYGVEK